MITKYVLGQLPSITNVDIPPHDVLDLQIQNGVLVVWVQERRGPRHKTTFVVYLTGETPAPGRTHLKTLQDGPYVAHIYR